MTPRTHDTVFASPQQLSVMMRAILRTQELLATQCPFSLPNKKDGVDPHRDIYAYPLHTFSARCFLTDAVDYLLRQRTQARNRRVGFLFHTTQDKTIAVIVEFNGIHPHRARALIQQLNTVGIRPNDLKDLYTQCQLSLVGADDTNSVKILLALLGQLVNAPLTVQRVRTDNDRDWIVQTLSVLQTGAPTTIPTARVFERMTHHCRRTVHDILQALVVTPAYVELTEMISLNEALRQIHAHCVHNTPHTARPAALARRREQHHALLTHYYYRRDTLEETVRTLPLILVAKLLGELEHPDALLATLRHNAAVYLAHIQTWEHALDAQENKQRKTLGATCYHYTQPIALFAWHTSYLPLGMQLMCWLGDLFPMPTTHTAPFVTVFGLIVGMELTQRASYRMLCRLALLTLIRHRLLRVRSRDFRLPTVLHCTRFSPTTLLRMSMVAIATVDAILTGTVAPLIVMVAALSVSSTMDYYVQKTFPNALNPSDRWILSLSAYQITAGLTSSALNTVQALWQQWQLCQEVIVRLRAHTVDIPYFNAYCNGPVHWDFWRTRPMQLEWTNDRWHTTDCRVHDTAIPTATVIDCAPPTSRPLPLFTH